MPPAIFALTTLPRELMLQIASSLDTKSILALTETSRLFSYLLCIFTIEYSIDQGDLSKTYTPLQYFVSRGTERVVQYLLESGENPNAVSTAPTKSPIPPLILAVRLNNPSMVSLLLKHGAHVDARDGQRKDDQSADLVDILDGVDIYPGSTPLHWALIHYSESQRQSPDCIFEGTSQAPASLVQIVQILLAAGADIQARNRSGYTPLHIAAGTRNVDTLLVTTLIAAGADVGCGMTSVRGTGGQAIHFAAAAGNKDVVGILVSAGVDVEVESQDGLRAVDLAVMGMHPLTLQMLVGVGADTSIRIELDHQRDESKDPLFLVGNTVRWNEISDWFNLRGWRNDRSGLSDWAGRWARIGYRNSRCGFRRWGYGPRVKRQMG